MKVQDIKKGDKLTIIINRQALRNPRARKELGEVADIDTITVDISDIDRSDWRKDEPKHQYFEFNHKDLKINGINGWFLVNGLYGEYQSLHPWRLGRPMATFLVNGEAVSL